MKPLLRLAVFDLDGTLKQALTPWQYLHQHLGLWNGLLFTGGGTRRVGLTLLSEPGWILPCGLEPRQSLSRSSSGETPTARARGK